MGKIASALAMTILDAIAAGTLAAVIAFILAVIASRVSGVGGPVQMVIRAFATVLRNIPTSHGASSFSSPQAGGIHRLSGAVLQKASAS